MGDLLRPLLDAIETVRTRISNHKPYLESDETRTRVSLVDPILQALGWDPSDPELVGLEWKIERKSADYALLSEDRKPTAIVEAKRLGTSLGGMDQLGQIGMYGLGGSAGLVTLTNGDQWHLYDLKNVQSDGGVVFKVRLSTDRPEAVAVQFLDLWRPYVLLKHRPPVEQGETERQHAAPGQAPTSAPAPPDASWILLDEIPKGAEPPASIRFADEFEAPLSDWPDLQVQVVRWLHKKGDLGKAPIPFRHSRKVKPWIRLQTKSSMWQWRPVPETDLEVSTVGTSQAVLERVQGLLRMCGHEPSSVRAKLRE